MITYIDLDFIENEMKGKNMNGDAGASYTANEASIKVEDSWKSTSAHFEMF